MGDSHPVEPRSLILVTRCCECCSTDLLCIQSIGHLLGSISKLGKSVRNSLWFDMIAKSSCKQNRSQREVEAFSHVYADLYVTHDCTWACLPWLQTSSRWQLQREKKERKRKTLPSFSRFGLLVWLVVPPPSSFSFFSTKKNHYNFYDFKLN